MRLFTAKLKVASAIVWIFVAAVPVAAQSLKIPFAALSPTYTPLWIADQAGLFKKYGLDAQLIYISAGSVIIPAILSGQVEIANMLNGRPLPTSFNSKDELQAIISPEAIPTAGTYIVTLKCDGEAFPESHRAHLVVGFKP